MTPVFFIGPLSRARQGSHPPVAALPLCPRCFCARDAPSALHRRAMAAATPLLKQGTDVVTHPSRQTSCCAVLGQMEPRPSCPRWPGQERSCGLGPARQGGGGCTVHTSLQGGRAGRKIERGAGQQQWRKGREGRREVRCCCGGGRAERDTCHLARGDLNLAAPQGEKYRGRAALLGRGGVCARRGQPRADLTNHTYSHAARASTAGGFGSGGREGAARDGAGPAAAPSTRGRGGRGGRRRRSANRG
jgi:hypothetical protein